MKDIFIITSVINTGTNKWSYTDIRSVYSSEERFRQTLETIESIRNLKDDTTILLIECSNISTQMEEIFREKTDIFINCINHINNKEIKHATLETDKKGYGEVFKLLIALNYILDNNINFDRIFKISGRYVLNNQFDKNNYSLQEYTFKISPDNGYSYSTVLYSVPNNLVKHYLDVIEDCVNIYKYNVIGLETLLPLMCNPKKSIKIIGVSGYCAVDGTSYTA